MTREIVSRAVQIQLDLDRALDLLRGVREILATIDDEDMPEEDRQVITDLCEFVDGFEYVAEDGPHASD